MSVVTAQLASDLLCERHGAAVFANVVARQQMNCAEPGRRENPLDFKEEVVDIDLWNMLQRGHRVGVVDAIVRQRNRDAVVEEELQSWVGDAVALQPGPGFLDHRRCDIQPYHATWFVPLKRSLHHVADPAADSQHNPYRLLSPPRAKLTQRVQA